MRKVTEAVLVRQTRHELGDGGPARYGTLCDDTFKCYHISSLFATDDRDRRVVGGIRDLSRRLDVMLELVDYRWLEEEERAFDFPLNDVVFR